MMIMTLHQGISHLAQSEVNAWKQGRYVVGTLYAIAARIASLIGCLFQIGYSPKYIIDATINNISRSLFERDSGGFCRNLWIAFKTTILAFSILVLGVTQSFVSIIAPEIVYILLKVQKLIYCQQIVRYTDLHYGVNDAWLTTAQNRFRLLGLGLDTNQFQVDFRAAWQAAALTRNTLSLYGEPDADPMFNGAVTTTLNSHFGQQVASASQTVRLPSSVSTRLMPLARPTVTSMSFHHLAEYATLGKIFFYHIKAATQDLVQRHCFSEEELQSVSTSALNAAVGLGLLKMLTASTLSVDETTLTVASASESLSLQGAVNVLDLRERFTKLKKLITKLEEGRLRTDISSQGYESAYKLLIDRLSASSSDVENQKIEKEREALLKKHTFETKLESKIFKRIGSLITIVNQRFINSYSNTSKINWSEAFSIS